MIVTDISRKKEQNNEPIRLAAYCRVSTSSDDQIHSFIAQVKYYREYEKDHPGCKLIGIYADEGITGTSVEKREEFKRMLQDCRDGKIDRIVVKSVSRFSRNNEECLSVLRELRELGVSVFFEKENLDTVAMNSEFMIALFGMNAQQESINISDNVRWSYQHRMRSGEFNTCNPALGFDLVDGKLKIVEEEANTVRKIFEMFLSGVAKETIAKRLNEEGVPTKRGTKWYVSSVYYILTNERYMGDAVLQKRYTTDTLPFRKKHNHGEREQYYVENSNDPIISRETFMAAKNLMELRKDATLYHSREQQLFHGVVKCAECGRTMKRLTNTSQPQWICRSYSRGFSTCTRHRVIEKDIMRAFTMLINKLKDNRKEVLDDTISLLEQAMIIAGGNRDRVHEIDVEIADLSKRKYKIAQLYEKRILNDLDYTVKTRDIDGVLKILREERKKLLAEDKEEESLEELYDLQKAIETYEKTNVFDRQLFEDIVNSIEVEASGMMVFHLLGGLKLRERSYA